MIKVLFFAQLRERLDCSEITLQLDTTLTVAKLRQQLAAESELWQQCLEDGKVLIAVNQTMAQADTLINPGDEVAFFPPVTGG